MLTTTSAWLTHSYRNIYTTKKETPKLKIQQIIAEMVIDLNLKMYMDDLSGAKWGIRDPFSDFLISKINDSYY